MEKLWEIPELKALTERVRKDCGNVGMLVEGAHALDTHTLVVAQYVQMIATDTGLVAVYDAWTAGFLHSTDRYLSVLLRRKVSEKEAVVEQYLTNCLQLVNPGFLNNEDIIYAVINHGRIIAPNDPENSPLLVVLQDADRVANLVDVVIRSGQLFNNLPPYDPRYIAEPDPRSKYGEPMSVLDDIRYSLEWETWIQTPVAKELAKPCFYFLKLLFENIERQLKETGLWPHPFVSDYE